MYQMASRLSHQTLVVSEQVRDTMRIKGEVAAAFLPPRIEDEFMPGSLAAWIAARRREGRLIVVSNASDLRQLGGEDLYGLDLLIEAFTRPEILRAHALLFMVASMRFGAERYAAMQREVVKRGLAPAVHIVGLNAPFAGVIKAADIVVRASNTDGDALSVREALWYGKRVLASDCVQRPEGCELFRSRDVEDFVRKLLDGKLGASRPVLRRNFADDVVQAYQRACA
jgi:hypothetical protein